MKTNVSTLLREFPKVRRAAMAGEEVIIVTREGNLRLTAVDRTGASILGCMKDRFTTTDDIDEPTTSEADWKPSPMSGCLDTHAAIWAFLDDPRLGRRARERIAEAPKNSLMVSDVVFLETAILHSKGRLPDCPLEELLAKIADNFRVIPIGPEIARVAVELELPHGDPFDRVIVATAKVHGAPLLTRDRAITDSGVVEIVW